MTTPETQPPEPKPGCRWYQFSLAGLLALTAIISIGLSLLKWSVDALPFVATLVLWIVTIFVDRRFSPRFSERPAAIAVALVLLGLFSACIVLAGRFFIGL
jgi:glucan phosphoethanolaminetransferase (alkaline phosphatase superfamily)